MKSTWIILLLVLIASTRSDAQTDEKTIERLLAEQVTSWNDGDIEGYMSGYWNSDSLSFVSGGILTHGYRGTLDRYKKKYGSKEKMGTLEFSNLVVRSVSASAAIATGVWRLNRTNDQPWGRFTLIVEKKPEGWRITHDHTSTGD